MLIDWVTESYKKSRANFKNTRTIFCTYHTTFLEVSLCKIGSHTKRCQGSFEEDVGKLKYGIPAVVNSQSLKLNIS